MNEITKSAGAIPALAGLVKPKVTKEELEDNVTTFYPQLMMGQAITREVQEGRVANGDFFIRNGGTCKPIGKECVVTFIDNQWFAADTGSRPKVFSYDVDSPDFKAIQDKSKTPRSKAFWGINYLCWLDDFGWVTFGCLNPTLRKVSGMFEMLTTMRLEQNPIKAESNQWFTIKPDEHEPSTQLPPPEEIKKAVEKFQSTLDKDAPDEAKSTRE